MHPSQILKALGKPLLEEDKKSTPARRGRKLDRLDGIKSSSKATRKPYEKPSPEALKKKLDSLTSEQTDVQNALEALNQIISYQQKLRRRGHALTALGVIGEIVCLGFLIADRVKNGDSDSYRQILPIVGCFASAIVGGTGAVKTPTNPETGRLSWLLDRKDSRYETIVRAIERYDNDHSTKEPQEIVILLAQKNDELLANIKSIKEQLNENEQKEVVLLIKKPTIPDEKKNKNESKKVRFKLKKNKEYDLPEDHKETTESMNSPPRFNR